VGLDEQGRGMHAGFRSIRDADYQAVTCLLNEYLRQCKLHQHFEEAEVRHFLTPKEGLVYVYVVEAPDGRITDFCSFYCLPSSILNHHQHTELRAAYMCAPHAQPARAKFVHVAQAA
jgi:glycylpeptide N-tetradecanoyltransferase